MWGWHSRLLAARSVCPRLPGCLTRLLLLPRGGAGALNRAITICLLARQQLERIDQVVAQPQRRYVRFEDLRFSGIDTELHYQNPVGCSPFVLASTSCTLPVAMFLLSVVAYSKWKLLQCGQTYDKVIPPNPSTGAMIRLEESVLILRISCAMPKRPTSSVATFS